MDKRTEANYKVRRQITDALFSLMHEKNFADITVTEIIRRAGVARVSYYRNFSSKEKVLTGLIDDVLQRFRGGEDYAAIQFMSLEHVKKAFTYFKEYGRYILDLYRSEFSNILLDELNKFHEAVAGYMPAKSAEKYTVYMYMGAMFNTAIKWLEAGAEDSIEEISAVFCRNVGIQSDGKQRLTE